MTITLTVSQVRQALQKVSGRTPGGPGSASTALIGTIFHKVLGELLKEDSRGNIESVLRSADSDLVEWKSILRDHAYDQLLGPLLTEHAVSLNSHGSEVLNLWKAVQDAADWFAELWWQITEHGTRTVAQADWFSVERPVVIELHEPGWREPVVLLGQTDAVLRIPQADRWCVLEWKIGRTSPDVDLAQACLYHLILGGNHPARSGSALAVVSFHPNRFESLFDSSQLVEAQARLFDLIGRMADVARPQETAAIAVGSSIPAPATTPATAATSAPAESGFASAGQSPAAPPTVVSAASRQQPEHTASSDNSGPESTVADAHWLEESREKMFRVLRRFGAACREVRPAVVGPAFVRFFLFPESGIKHRKVLDTASELHLHMGLPALPTMSVVEGTIAVDLPRPDRQSIPFSALKLQLPAVNEATGCAGIPVGVDLNGEWTWCDLSAHETPHLLVVGTTGSGKSQWLRAGIASLISTNTPDTLELLLIDPKQNAFTFATDSPFLKRPIIVPGDDQDVVEILLDLIQEMEQRYSMMAGTQSQSLAEHIRASGQRIKRIVLICDEYADLLDGSESNERRQLEKCFRRIAQKGRAAGIHLILATQQPRTNILTASIRSLLPAKVTLRVSDAVESRVALGEAGAERLLGQGDLLYKSLGRTVRLQGSWLPAEDEQMLTGNSPDPDDDLVSHVRRSL